MFINHKPKRLEPGTNLMNRHKNQTKNCALKILKIAIVGSNKVTPKWIRDAHSILSRCRFLPNFTKRASQKWNNLIKSELCCLEEGKIQVQERPILFNGIIWFGSDHFYTYIKPLGYNTIITTLSNLKGAGLLICFFQLHARLITDSAHDGSFIWDKFMQNSMCSHSKKKLFQMENSNWFTCLPCLFNDFERHSDNVAESVGFEHFILWNELPRLDRVINTRKIGA
jgi:hypothetical protein